MSTYLTTDNELTLGIVPGTGPTTGARPTTGPGLEPGTGSGQGSGPTTTHYDASGEEIKECSVPTVTIDPNTKVKTTTREDKDNNMVIIEVEQPNGDKTIEVKDASTGAVLGNATVTINAVTGVETTEVEDIANNIKTIQVKKPNGDKTIEVKDASGTVVEKTAVTIDAMTGKETWVTANIVSGITTVTVVEDVDGEVKVVTTNYDADGNITEPYLEALLKGDEYNIECVIDEMKESLDSDSYYDDFSVECLRDEWLRGSADEELVAASVNAAYSTIFYNGGSKLIDGLYDGYYSEKKYDGFSMTKEEFQLLAAAALADTILDSEKKRRRDKAYYDTYYESDYYSRNMMANNAARAREQSLVGIKGNFLQAVVDLHYMEMESVISPPENGAVLQKLPGEAQG